MLSLFYVYPFRCQLCGHRFRSLQWGVSYARISEDRREYRRLPIMFPVAYVAENIKGKGTAIDVSVNGCGFETRDKLSVGAHLRMTLQLTNELLPVEVDTAVVRTVDDNRMGVEFVKIQPAELERLQLFIRGRLAGRRE
jgi:c-di-GMP-binding flagellar brake protein YcgR